MHRAFHTVFERGHMREQVEMLKTHADVAAPGPQMARAGGYKSPVFRHMRQGLTIDIDATAIDLLQRHQHAQHGGFAGPRRADDRDHFALRHIQIEVVEHGQRAISFAHFAKPDHRCCVASEFKREIRKGFHCLIVPFCGAHSLRRAGSGPPQAVRLLGRSGRQVCTARKSDNARTRSHWRCGSARSPQSPTALAYL